MAYCNICNKQIEEGILCKDCAQTQNQARVNPTPRTNPGGFSLSGLLKKAESEEKTPAQDLPNFAPTAPEPPLSPKAPAAPSGNEVPPFAAPPAYQAPPMPHTTAAPPAPATQGALPPSPTSPPQQVLSPTRGQVPHTPPAIAPRPPLSTPSAAAPLPPSGAPQPSVATPSAAVPPLPVASSSSSAPAPSFAPKTIAPLSASKPAAQREVKPHLDEDETLELFSSEETGFGDEELEVILLSGVMKEPFLLETLKGKGLIAGLFSTRYSRGIYQSILLLREENPEQSALDKIVLKNKLRQTNLWDSESQALVDRIIAEAPPALDHALHYLVLMKEQALKRKLKEVASSITHFIENPQAHPKENIETFTNKVIHSVRNIQKARTTKRISLVREEMKDILEDIDSREKTGEIDIIGYSFEPMHYLNMALSGFRKGFMYAIAGAPRRGKTTFTLELATRVATLNQIPVLFFTYEQTKKNLTYRLLAKESRLNPDTLQRKRIRSDMVADAKFMGGWKKMQDYMEYFYIIEATKEDTVDRIRSYAYNVMQDFNTEDIMIFIDYIQKMPLSRDYMDEKFKVEEISTELKGLSIELNNPIMAISSLSKEGCMIDATPDAERPIMYHCKGSGDLEYDLDCAMIQAKDWGDTKELYQQLQHKAEEMGKDTTRVPKVDVVNLYLDKNRDAPEGIYSTIQYLFFIKDNKFIELGPKFEDDRFRFSKIEELVEKLIQENFIVFYDRPKDSTYNKGRVSIKLKDF